MLTSTGPVIFAYVNGKIFINLIHYTSYLTLCIIYEVEENKMLSLLPVYDFYLYCFFVPGVFLLVLFIDCSPYN